MEREKGVGIKWGDIHLIPNFASGTLLPTPTPHTAVRKLASVC